MNSRIRGVLGGIVLVSTAASGLVYSAPSRAASAVATEVHRVKMSTLLFPTNVPAGEVQLAVTNDTKREAQVVVGRLKNGMSQAAAVKIMLSTSDTAFIQIVKSFTFVGRADQIEPGQQVTATLILTPGSYALVNGDGAKPI